MPNNGCYKITVKHSFLGLIAFICTDTEYVNVQYVVNMLLVMSIYDFSMTHFCSSISISGLNVKWWAGVL